MSKKGKDNSHDWWISLVIIVIFIVLWQTGILAISFEAILLFATVVSLIFFIIDRCVLRKKRKAVAEEFKESFLKKQENEKAQGIISNATPDAQYNEMLKEPAWIEWTAGLAPILVIIFLLRSFVAEPFQIPSGSMMPTMVQGDKILVEKSHYGLRIPVLGGFFKEFSDVQRGDIIVFDYPMNTSIKYIKRVVGLPGDTVEYKGKTLFVNGKEFVQTNSQTYEYPAYLRESNIVTQQEEDNLGKKYKILTDAKLSPTIAKVLTDEVFKNCVYQPELITCKVPEGHYFAMGDNRDASLDSRYWGFVPKDNIVGKATLIWANFSDWDRVGFVE